MFSTGSAKPGFYLAGCFFLLFASIVFAPVSGHDWQRAAECLLSLFSFCVIVSVRTTILGSVVRLTCLIVLILGTLSAVASHQPQWAILELSVLVSCCCIGSALALQRKKHGCVWDRFLIAFLMFLCALKCLQFFAALTAALFSGVGILDSTILFEGFSNRRFYGQFQTFTLALLAFPLMSRRTRPSTKAFASLLLACWWMIAIAGGTRGTWLGMVCASVFIFCSCGQWGRRWIGWQLAAAAVGLLLFWCFFSLLPSYLNIEVTNFAGDRLNASLSARDILWHQAWDMIKERPLLGFGPMHFADIHNVVAAHPHQAILQWACEWGGPSTLLVMGLAAYGLLQTVKLIRRKAASSEPVDLLRICLLASLTGALAQSMVDGVIVMPYSQLWLALVVGWLMGIHEWSARPAPGGAVMRWGWIAVVMLAVGFLSYVVIRDFPHRGEREDQYAHDFGGNLQPRFWQQGVIATTP